MALENEYDYMTYEEYLTYISGLDNSVEYSNGEIFCMSPTHPIHNKVQNELYFQIRGILKDCSKCDVYTSDVAVNFKADEVQHQFEPDLMVVCDNKFDGAIYKGIPDLIIEVLSRATKDRDTGIKLDVYEKFGVKEYWIVDINLKEIIVYSNNKNGKYRSIMRYSEDMKMIWNEGTIRLKEIFKFFN